jgi:DNA-binding Lrp family transcriptional regulator
MDEKDLQILKTVEELETTSTDAVSDATGIPVSTVHYRLNNLREEGVITSDRLDVDLDALGLDITVLVEVFLKGEQDHSKSGQAIAEIEGVTKAFFTMGDTDFVALARLPSSESVERLISDFEALEDVSRTNSTFVISRELDSHYPLQHYSQETLEDELLE